MLEKIFFIFFLLAMGACSWSPHPNSEYATLYFSILGQKKSLEFLPALREEFLYTGSGPSALSSFSCLGVNIVGSRISPVLSDTVPEKYIPKLHAGESCSYPGVMSKPILISQDKTEVILLVPSGEKRVIQVLGIQDLDKNYCTQEVPLSQTIEARQKFEDRVAFYEIGKSISDVFNDISVTISDNYSNFSQNDQAKKRADCEDNAFSSVRSLESPPSTLSYATNPVIYTKNILIVSNPPSLGSGMANSFSINPSLPAGLELNTSSGAISGTPTVSIIPTDFKITASNSAGSTTVVLRIEVKPVEYADLTLDHIMAVDTKLATANRYDLPNTGSLALGDIIVYKTSQNRFGKLEIIGFASAAAGAKNLEIKYTTYNSDGSVYRASVSTTVQSTYPFDLDDAIAYSGSDPNTKPAQDLFWGNAPPNYLTGFNTGRLFRYSF